MVLKAHGLTVTMLGGLRFTWQGEELVPQSRKGAALLALLARSHKSVEREELAELLWEPGKLASVRQALYELRKLPGADGWLIEDGSTVRLVSESDVTHFEAASRNDSERATTLYTGPFLEGFKDLGVPAFTDWVANERDALGREYLTVLKLEAARLEREGQLAAARLRVQEALEMDALDESLYRTGMRLSYAEGDLVRARELYTRCVRMLREEFGAEPAEEAQRLAAMIEREERLPAPIGLTGLPDQQLRLLQALAVGAGALGVNDTAEVLERDSFEVANDLAALQGRGLVDAHLGVDVQVLTQVLTSMPVAVRRLLHERAAEVLITGPKVDDAVVAQHLLAGGNPAAAAPRFLSAAKDCIERSDLHAAVNNLFRVLWADGGTAVNSVRLDAVILLEGIASQRAEDDLQDAALDEVRRLAWARQSDPHLAEYNLRQSRRELKRGQLGEALERALEALAIGHRLEDETLIARSRTAAGGVQFYSGDLDGAAESFRSNLDVANEVERFRANNNLGSLNAMRGNLSEAYACFDRALTLARAHASKAEVGATLNNLAATAERLSDYGRAVRHFREGLDLARRAKANTVEGQMLVNLAVVYARQGHLGPAWNTVLEVEELSQQYKDPRLLVHVLEQKGEVLRHCGLASEALDTLREAVAGAEKLNDERKVLALKAQLATLEYVEADGAFEAVESAITALSSARLSDISPWLWTELALNASSPQQVEQLLAGNGGSLTNRHIRMVAEVARLRASLLPGGDLVSGAVPLRQLTDKSLAVAEGAGGGAGQQPDHRIDLASLEVSECPYGWWLVKQWLKRSSDTSPAIRIAREAAEAAGETGPLLQQQGLGLPKRLREAHGQLPKRWADQLA